MTDNNPSALKLFEDDVKKTYQHILSRVKHHEEAGTADSMRGGANGGEGEETIQLVQEGTFTPLINISIYHA
jgi:hypothetical protein